MQRRTNATQFEMIQVAASADVSYSSVRRYFEPKPMHRTTTNRIEKSLRRHGLEHLIRKPADQGEPTAALSVNANR